MTDRPTAERTVRLLARATDRAGLSTAYGHCSVRLDAASFLVCAPKPMGRVTPQDAGSVVRLDAPLPDHVLGEVRLHREVYRRRPDVNAIVRCLPSHVTALAALGRTPKPRHGFGAYFWPQVPFWSDPALVRNDEAAHSVADLMADAAALVLSVNGAVVAGADAAQALTLALFLEDSARVELAALHAGCEAGPLLTEAQCQGRATWAGRVAERQWDYWTAGDPEQA